MTISSNVGMAMEVLDREVTSDGRCVVGHVEDFADGDRWLVRAGTRTVGLFRIGDAFYALLNRCPHAGAELCRGEVLPGLRSDRTGDYSYVPDQHIIVCPWHAWEFDLVTGHSHIDPARVRVKSYPVDIEKELQAETYSVEADGAYVIIDLRSRRVW